MLFKDPENRKQYAEEYYARNVMRKNGELSLQHLHCRGSKYTVTVFCHVSLYFAVEAFHSFDRQLAKNIGENYDKRSKNVSDTFSVC